MGQCNVETDVKELDERQWTGLICLRNKRWAVVNTVMSCSADNFLTSRAAASFLRRTVPSGAN